MTTSPPAPLAPTPTTSSKPGRVRWPAMHLLLALTMLPDWLVSRWREVQRRGDEGSITVEKAIIAAIAIGLALGLMAAIAAVVAKYQARIQ
jgi:hypothetical protein